MDDQPRRSALFWLVLVVCAVYAGLFAFTVYAVARYYGVEKAPSWSAIRNDGHAWYVSEVDDAGPAAGRIHHGDRLLAINGDERHAVVGLFEWSFVEGGKTYRVDLERSGERVSLELPLPLVPQRLTPIFALVGLAFFICGAALALLRPGDGQVRLVGAFLMSVGFVRLYQTLQVTFSFLVGWERIVHYGIVPLSVWALPLAYDFFSRFPVGRSPGPFWRSIQWLLYALFALVIWPALMTSYLGLSISDIATRFMVRHPQLYMGAYLVMELVAGRTWRDEPKRSGVIAPLRAAEWFRQLLEGLQFAHTLGVVHRDLKPENVMIVEAASGADELKVMDFGLAKVLGGGTGVSDSLTEAGAVMGTFGYIAPEVFTGGPVDERADIFAIGVMVVETLVGARPFDGQTPHEIINALLHSGYHLPGESAEIRALDAVVQHCLAKDPRYRYGAAVEVATELVPILARGAGLEAVRG